MAKRLAAALLCAAMAMALAAASSAAPAFFPDVKDDSLARDVAALQMLGVVSGDERGNFSPGATLTRAAFCKMAVVAMGRADEEPLYRNRTVFSDVRADHWARGYINLAVSGEKKIMYGSGGLFRPDNPVTRAEAVTVLLRLLGYSDADAGMLWPDGYVALAKKAGLSDGVELSPYGAPVTRAEAARLFSNLLGAEKKDGGSYISGLGTVSSGVVVMQLGVTAPDGSGGAIRTSAGVYKVKSGVLPPAILGLRGALLTDSSGRALTFLPDRGRQITVTAAEADASWIRDSGGQKYSVAPDAPAYTASEAGTYGKLFANIAPGMRLTLFFSKDGDVDGVYIGTSKASDAVVVAGSGASPATVASLTGGDTGYKIFKNGAEADWSDIRQYDVITYDRSAKILSVSDFRLTAYYENCWPNMTSPLKVTIFGREFPALPCAAESLSRFSVGQVVTFLFTSDFQIAGAASGVAGSTAVGIAQSVTSSSATVKLLNGLELSGDPGLGDYSASQLRGEIVTVSSYAPRKISISRIGTSALKGELDLTRRTLGALPLSPAVKVFERVGTSAAAQISLGELSQAMIPSSKVLYAEKDYAGRVGILVLDDVTGDLYTYGFLKAGELSAGSFGDEVVKNPAVSVVNGDNPSGTAPVVTGLAFTDGAPGGVAVSADGERAAAIVALTEVRDVKRSAFYTSGGVVYARIGGMDIPVSKNVQCYNSLGKTWFASLDDARAFSETLKVYYDRPPEEGGKIRMVVA